MDKQYVIPLNALQADLETVGGKGMSLAKLARAGLPVPGGFHVTTEAYREFVIANDLQAGINEALQHVDVSQPSTLETASETIGRLFADSNIPPNIASAITNAYNELNRQSKIKNQLLSVPPPPPKTCQMRPSPANRRPISILSVQTRYSKPLRSVGPRCGRRALSATVLVKELAPKA